MMGVSCVDYQRYLDQWGELCAQAGIDLYVHEKYGRQLLLGCHLLPPPCLEEDLKYFHRQGVRGVQLHTAMGGWWTSATTMLAAAKQLWDVNASVADTTSQTFRAYYGAHAALASRVISRYEESARSWQYANVNLNLNLHQRLVPDESYPAASESSTIASSTNSTRVSCPWPCAISPGRRQEVSRHAATSTRVRLLAAKNSGARSAERRAAREIGFRPNVGTKAGSRAAQGEAPRLSPRALLGRG